MKTTLNKYELQQIFSKCYNTALKKNSDYGCESLLNNGRQGILIRMDDKMSRLKNLIQIKNNSSKIKAPKCEESIKDTCIDLINYSAYLIMINENKLVINEKCSVPENLDSKEINLKISDFNKFPDKLDIIYDSQKKLQTKLPRMDIKDNILAIQAEVIEALNETPWKPWKSKSSFDIEKFKEELIDVFKFWLNMAIIVDMKPNEIAYKFDKKTNINYSRQQNGY